MKSGYQIAANIVAAWHYGAKICTAHKVGLVAAIAEELEKQRTEGYARCASDHVKQFAMQRKDKK